MELIMISAGASKTEATAEVDAAIDRLVHYAGWTDKLAAVFGSANPVSSPYFSYSAPEPTGVVGILAPQRIAAARPGLGDRAGDHQRQCLRGDRRRADPCVAITFAEVVATSDLPGGVINILTGRAAELAPHLAAHARRQRLGSHRRRRRAAVSLEQAAAETVKRVYAPKGVPDFAAAPGTARLRAFLEIKTVWHPTGALSLSGGSSY